MSARTIVALSGGIGGAKLALGLTRVLPPGALTVVVNTGDDFEHLGLMICPDLDTTLYTLGGLANPELGWGRADETWTFMRVLETLGGESWFRLGDGDLALHVERTRRLAAGESLTTIIADVARRFGIGAAVVPMSESPVRTRVLTAAGELAFQDYFVRQRCAPALTGVRFAGADAARAAPAAVEALTADSLAAIVICPSNPYLSIDPILAVPGMRQLLEQARVPVIAVSPLVGSRAVKGPTAKIMQELGVELSARAIAAHYADVIDALVLDEADAGLAAHIPVPVHVCKTLMVSLGDREQLAREVLGFASRLSPG
ncbi:MAG: 2-phospho-L-lactate transferase [Proteobacteria bacterium]|nr:2-phospho-L-lactate transferase [Pseudomonadota bacterium]